MISYSYSGWTGGLTYDTLKPVCLNPNSKRIAMEQGEKRYIAVEGPIGVGKTSLTRMLAAGEEEKELGL